MFEDGVFSRINDLAKKQGEILRFFALPVPYPAKTARPPAPGFRPRSWSIARPSTAAAGVEAAIAAAAGQAKIQELVDHVAHLVTAARPHSVDINLLVTSKQHQKTIINTSS